MAYQLFTGQLPFQAETWIALSYRILNAEPIAARTINPNLPETVEAALGRALNKNALERFPTCSAFVEALTTAIPVKGAAPPVVTVPVVESLSVILAGRPMDFVKIPAGRFVMGCDSCEDALKPEHMVEISRSRFKWDGRR